MADKRAIIARSGGGFAEHVDADTLLVGAGIKNGGTAALTVTGGSAAALSGVALTCAAHTDAGNTAVVQTAYPLTSTFAPVATAATDTSFRAMTVGYTINQTGAFAHTGVITGLRVAATETALLSSTHNLLDLLVGSSSKFSVSNAGAITAAGGLGIVQDALTTGAFTALGVTGGAHTGMTASTEAIGVNLNQSATKQWATGAITTQREVLIQAPTYAFVAASTITSAATLAITGAPIAGTNATITTTSALVVSSGRVGFGTNSPNATVLEVFGSGASTVSITPLVSFASPSGVIPWALKQNAAESGNPTLMWFETATGNLAYVAANTNQLEIGGQSGKAVGICTNASYGAPQFLVSTNGNTLIGPSVADVASSRLIVQADKTIASAAGAIYDGASFAASTATLTGSTNITTATGFNFLNIAAPTLSAASALAVTYAATVRISGAPTGAGGGPCTVTNAYSLWVDDGAARFDGRVLGFHGADVASANDTTLSTGNYFDITGAVQINGIAVAGWTVGSVVILQFDSNPVVKHNTAASAGFASLQLAGSVDFNSSAGDTLMLVYDGTYWRQIPAVI